MSEIEWTDEAWNPGRGCSLASTGCENCYAMKQAHRFSGEGGAYEGLTELGPDGPRWTGAVRMAPRQTLVAPLRWRMPRRIFVDSMTDLFHKGFSTDEIDAVFGVMWACRYLGRHEAEYAGHTFQVLTKRPERALDYFLEKPKARRLAWARAAVSYGGGENPDPLYDSIIHADAPHPRIHLGVSAENQKYADERLNLLVQIPAAVRFVSLEPLLGPVRLGLLDTLPEGKHPVDTLLAQKLHWVIVGGESGPGARPFDTAWARQLVQECDQAKTPVFIKQLGRVPRGDGLVSLGKRSSKGNDMAQWPEDLRGRRAFPPENDA